MVGMMTTTKAYLSACAGLATVLVGLFEFQLGLPKFIALAVSIVFPLAIVIFAILAVHFGKKMGKNADCDLGSVCPKTGSAAGQKCTRREWIQLVWMFAPVTGWMALDYWVQNYSGISPDHKKDFRIFELISFWLLVICCIRYEQIRMRRQKTSGQT